MSKYLRRYRTVPQYNYERKNNYFKPWVSLTDENQVYNFNKEDGEDERLYSTPLTFEITAPGNISWTISGSSPGAGYTIQYSKNGGEWTSITSASGSATPLIPVVAGDVVQFRGDNIRYSTTINNYTCFSGTTAGFKVKGNIMSLRNSTNFSGLTSTGVYQFNYLLSYCPGLTDASELLLPSGLIDTYSLHSLFEMDTALVSAPDLPSTNLGQDCYRGMFYGCSSLVNAPYKLPATTLNSNCYAFMFQDCTSLESVSEDFLPATNVESSAYTKMFAGCTSLTGAPTLPAKIVKARAYAGMFSGCSQLSYLKCLAQTPGTYYSTENWLNGVATYGTFVKNENVSAWTRSTSGIPTNWGLIDNKPLIDEPLTFIVKSAGYIEWHAFTSSYTVDLKYSKNGEEWKTLKAAKPTGNVYVISVTAGDVVKFKGYAPLNDGQTWNTSHTFSGTTCSIQLAGNLYSILDGNNFKNMRSLSAYPYTFYNLFRGCNVVEAGSLVMPATEFASDLTYGNMFVDCSGLKTAPVMPGEVLGYRSHWHMFHNCTGLKWIKCLATDISAYQCTDTWLYNASAVGLFVKNPSMSSWPRTNGGIPSGWNVEDSRG